MSNYHRIHCWSCDEDEPNTRLNWGGHALAIYLHLVDEILEACSLTHDFEDGWTVEVSATALSSTPDLAWLREHRHHMLIVVGEYTTRAAHGEHELSESCEGGVYYVRAMPQAPSGCNSGAPC